MFQSFTPVSDPSFGADHVPLLRAVLKDQGLDGFIIPHDDEYLNEYLPDRAERLMWISGFSGSAGLAIVLTEKAAAFSDGRYDVQLPEQVDTAMFEAHITHRKSPEAWLAENTTAGAKIGYDPLLHSRASLAPFEEAAEKGRFTLVPLSQNPIDIAWTDQPDAPSGAVTVQPLEFAGEAMADKLSRMAGRIAAMGGDAALITSPTSIAWLFNIRGGDVHASPLPLARAILSKDGAASLFIDPAKLSKDALSHLAPVRIAPEEEAFAALESLGANEQKVLVDPGLTPLGFVSALRNAGAVVVETQDPIALPRAIKNETELEGTRQAHIRDGVAITRFLKWFSETAPKGGLTEIAAAEKLEGFRTETGVLKDISFDTISAAGPHGAMPHYRVTTKSDLPIEPGSLYLVDSGGQYQDGTTDITRTLAVGTPTAEMAQRYTLVLRGHIALAVARFPKGTSGHALDALARLPLWQAGLDYDHGTGHGVGSYLGVHEGPQNISKRPVNQALEPGMICSNEPGYYKPGEYGIRIENLIIVEQTSEIEGGEREMLSFETITLAPLERELIVSGLLTKDEIAWVDAYHARVYDTLADKLDEAERAWLKGRTAPL